jgi:hypothetical protein
LLNFDSEKSLDCGRALCVASFLSLFFCSSGGIAMVSSSLAWQLFLGIVSVAEMAVFVLGSVLLGAYVATLWQARGAFGRPMR